MSGRLFLGIDGGGTRCRARLCDDAGRTLGEGTAGAANVRLGLERAFWLSAALSLLGLFFVALIPGSTTADSSP